MIARLILAVGLACALCAQPIDPAKVKLGKKIRLLNGKDLSGFDIYLQKQGMNKDPDRVFQVEKGQVHVSGTDYGYIITKQDYENYYLMVEFRWGPGTHPPRKDKARDSGVLYHVSGENKIWPRSVEFQMIEGGTGDIIMVGNASATVKGVTKDRGRFDRYGKGPWKDVAGYRDPVRELEKPFGEWNRIEMWAIGDSARYHVNGVLANEASALSDRRGKLVFQTEGAELFFRKIELRPIR
ncbi:MAG: 3-keto-disaccharide hydrolase [Bryobacteraceae bacterium]